MAGSISQSSHQYAWRVNRRAINRRLTAITASVNVAILAPSIRGTWVACRSTPDGGGGSPIIGNTLRVFLMNVSNRAQKRACFNRTRYAWHTTALERTLMSSRGGAYEGSHDACAAPKYVSHGRHSLRLHACSANHSALLSDTQLS